MQLLPQFNFCSSSRSVRDEIQSALNQSRLGTTDLYTTAQPASIHAETRLLDLVNSKKNPQTSSLTNLLLQNDMNSYQNGPGFFSSSNKKSMDDGASLDLLNERKTLGFRRNTWCSLKKKHLCLLLYLGMNFIWTSIIIGMSILNCIMVYDASLSECKCLQ